MFMKIVKELWEYVKLIIIVLVAVFILNHFVIINARIPSPSMENTIMTGDQIFGNRLSYLFDDPERYDIVIFEWPDDPEQLFIKRVIGLPGETVEIRDGMTLFPRRWRAISGRTQCRKTATLCWAITETTPRTPATG